MTRKRFTKLLMGHGHSRNVANCIACKCNIPYNDYYSQATYLLVIAEIQYSAESVKNSFELIGKAMQNSLEALKQLIVRCGL